MHRDEKTWSLYRAVKQSALSYMINPDQSNGLAGILSLSVNVQRLCSSSKTQHAPKKVTEIVVGISDRQQLNGKQQSCNL